MRRLAAALSVIATFTMGGVLWALPVTISVLGTTGTCGPAIYAALSEHTSYGTDQMNRQVQPLCRDQGLPQSLAGAILGAGGLLTGASLLWLNTSRWPKSATEFRYAMAHLHEAGPDGQCATCRVTWPCPTAHAVRWSMTNQPHRA
ncbi:hypothetical protein [Streptomyces sp. NPDC002537]